MASEHGHQGNSVQGFAKKDLPAFIGNSSKIREARKTIERIKDDCISVAILAPSGGGKDVVANLLHYGSRWSVTGKFVAHNCAQAADGALEESRFFGHERGAFTGATRRRLGVLELARGGTLFLDEAQSLSRHVQSLLLRALEGKDVYRVGGEEAFRIRFRLVLATNRPLLDLVREERILPELYYRVKGVTIELPPLSERTEDIVLLVEHFNDLMSKKRGQAPLVFSPEALKALHRHSWPGNVRELEHEMERLFALGTSPMVRAEDLSPEVYVPGIRPGETGQGHKSERTKAVLDSSGGRVVKAARALGIHRTTVWRRLKDRV